MEQNGLLITKSADSDNNLQVLMEGQLVIRNANAIRKELLLALNSFQNLRVVFRNIIKIDMAVLQLLIALQKSAAILEKKLSFDIELTSYVKLVLQNSGLDKILIPDLQKPA